MILRRLGHLIFFLLVFCSCVRSREKHQKPGLDNDFDVETFGSGTQEVEEGVAPDPEFKFHDPLNHSSLPLELKVGSKVKLLDDTPAEAKPPASVFQLRRFGRCTFGLKAGQYELSRFYLAGEQWIPVAGEIQPNTVLKIAVDEHLYLKFTAPIFIRIAKANFAECVKALRGKKSSIALFSFRQSTMELLPGPGAQNRKMERMPLDSDLVQLNVNWPASSVYPTAEDADGNPYYLSSSMYHAHFPTKGQYFVAIKPVLDSAPLVSGPQISSRQ